MLIAEGDSWYEYQWQKDTIMALSWRYKVLGLARAGDTVGNILEQDELLPVVRAHAPDIALLSIGGNDIVDNVADFVHPFSPSRPSNGPAYVKSTKFRRRLSDLFDRIEPMCQTILDLGVDVIVSGYDYSNPRGPGEVGAQWLGPVLLAARRIDNRLLWHLISKYLIDLYEIEIRQFVARMNKGRAAGAQVSFVSAINAVNNGTYDPSFGAINVSWNDEMHPLDAGFARLGDRIAVKIDQVVQRRSMPVAYGASEQGLGDQRHSGDGQRGEGHQHPADASEARAYTLLQAVSMQGAADDQQQADSMHEGGGRAHQRQQDQRADREGSILRKVPVHADGAHHLLVAAIAHTDQLASPQADDIGLQRHVHQDEQSCVEGRRGERGGHGFSHEGLLRIAAFRPGSPAWLRSVTRRPPPHRM